MPDQTAVPPVAPAQDAPPAVPPTPPAPSPAPAVELKSLRWQVSLPHDAVLVIKFDEKDGPQTREAAVEEYKAMRGIRSTPYAFDAVALPDVDD